jgi:hypothetical protein
MKALPIAPARNIRAGTMNQRRGDWTGILWAAAHQAETGATGRREFAAQ